jgi:cullin 3
MVLHKQGEKLYNGVEGVIKNHLVGVAKSTIIPVFPQIQQTSNTSSSSSSAAAGSSSGGDASGSGLSGTVLVGGPEFLRVLKTVWDDHTTCMVMIRDILLYMVSLAPLSDSVIHLGLGR